MNDPKIHPEIPEMIRNRKQLCLEETFTFGCHPGISCFNTCCRDVNIFLTPLDTLTLSRATGVDTEQFLFEHVLFPVTKDLHLPAPLLRMTSGTDKRCPFAGDEGCIVYADRPWACRMYPLGSALPPARADQVPTPIYFLMEDSFCSGAGEQIEWTAAAYRESQGVPSREALEAGFQEIVSHPWFIGGRQLDPARIEMFHMAAYNLDAFRRFVFSSTFLKRFELDDGLVTSIRTSDIALLQFSFVWLRFALFGEPTMKIRPET
jgi:Fe-S-cluster containining protein